MSYSNLRYLCIALPTACCFGYYLGQQQVTGMFGPIKTKRYYTIQHWLKTGGGVPEDEPIPVGVEWLEWDKLPIELRGSEWFCWQNSGQTATEELTFSKFINAHICKHNNYRGKHN